MAADGSDGKVVWAGDVIKLIKGEDGHVKDVDVLWYDWNGKPNGANPHGA